MFAPSGHTSISPPRNRPLYLYFLSPTSTTIRQTRTKRVCPVRAYLNPKQPFYLLSIGTPQTIYPPNATRHLPRQGLPQHKTALFIFFQSEHFHHPTTTNSHPHPIYLFPHQRAFIKSFIHQTRAKRVCPVRVSPFFQSNYLPTRIAAKCARTCPRPGKALPTKPIFSIYSLLPQNAPLQPSCYQMRLARVFAPSGHTSIRNAPIRPLYLCFFNRNTSTNPPPNAPTLASPRQLSFYFHPLY